MKDLQLENKLSSQYTQLLASAKLTLLEKRTLSQLIPFMQGKKEANGKRVSILRILAENEEELDRIYDELVKVRTKIAKL